jgi:hypothetical protein
MAAAATFALPGVYFLPKPQAAAVDLPPLDVSGFVGFATRGPVDVPVPIEDLSHFDAIFGSAFAVARDAQGMPVYAKLRDAVAAFFSSGGARCYIVRVAGTRARPARIAMPGMLAVDSLGRVVRVELDAASVGQWGDSLRVGTVLTAVPLPVKRFTISDGKTLAWTLTGAPSAVQAGDILRLTVADGRQWLFPVNSIQPSAVEETQLAALVSNGVWRLSTGVGSLPPIVVAVQRMTLEGVSSLNVSATFSVAGSGVVLTLDGSDALHVLREDLLAIDLADGSRFVFAVADAQARRSSSSTPQATITATELICVREPGGGLSLLPSGAALSQVERLQANLRIVWKETVRSELEDLGFNGGHPRFWGDIAVAESGPPAGAAAAGGSATPGGATLAPGDATRLYADVFGTVRADLDWTDARLPIVASSLFAPAQASGLTYLPVGMPEIGSDADLVGSETGTPADDDLDHFAANPFLDPTLVNVAQPASNIAVPVASLLATATDQYFLQNIRLRGIHALMFVDEVALIAVPDAVNLGWSPGEILPVFAPRVSGTPLISPAGFGECGVPPVLASVDPAGGPISTPGKPPTLVTITGNGFATAGPIGVTFGGLAATDVQVISPTTLTCRVPQAGAPGTVAVTVTTVAGGASLSAGFLYWVPSTEPSLPIGIALTNFDPETLQKIHVSLVGLCQARADAVAVMALPLHFGKSECIAWRQTLRQNLHLPRHGATFSDARDVADLSYAAVYHPWPLIIDPSGPVGTLRPVPPDGTVCGVIAAREKARQVWVAPANLRIAGVLDLQPALSRDDWAQLFALGFNLLREEALDFRVMSAHTLADDASLLQLSVRRMLIQLRKAVLKRGQLYVFEKNDERFRERVRHGLEALLSTMFDGGAFAGATQQSSYRIAVDSSVNTADDADQGRMIAQILVAPSQPMEFLTVLLTRTGEGSLQAAEA